MSRTVVLPEPARLSLSERLAGHAAVAAARLVCAATAARPARLRRLLAPLMAGGLPASEAQASRARQVVETVSYTCASPHGCLLRSVAIVLVCRSRGRRVTWRLGMTGSPPACHAWIEAGGKPVGEPVDPRPVYESLVTI